MRRLLKFATGLATGVSAYLLSTSVAFATAYDDYLYSSASDAASASAFAGLSIVWVCCIFIFALAVPAVLAYIVYKDATKNGVENAVIWAIVTFFFNVVGLLVYFLAIKPGAMKDKGGASKSEDK